MSFDKRSAVRTTRKVCAKCGKASWVTPRERRCKRQERNAWGKTHYWCYGTLKIPERRQPVRNDESAVLRQAIMDAQAVAALDAGAAAAADKIRADARRKLTHAETKLKEAMTDLKRVTRRIGQWQARVSYQSKRAAITTEEVRVEREKRRRAATA